MKLLAKNVISQRQENIFENQYLSDIYKKGAKERRDSVLELPTITKEQI